VGPRLKQRDGALGAPAGHRLPVHLVQLTDELNLDCDHRDRLGGEQNRGRQQGRRRYPLDGGHTAAGRTDTGRRTSGVTDQTVGQRLAVKAIVVPAQGFQVSYWNVWCRLGHRVDHPPHGRLRP
jgi:hypothetical protein